MLLHIVVLKQGVVRIKYCIRFLEFTVYALDLMLFDS